MGRRVRRRNAKTSTCSPSTEAQTERKASYCRTRRTRAEICSRSGPKKGISLRKSCHDFFKEQGLDLSDLDEDPRQRRERERAAELAADLESAKELISPPKISSPNGEQYDIATFRPQTKDEFEEFSKRLTTLITNFGDSPQYAMFVTGLVKAISEPLGSDDVKKVASGLTTLGNEKLKAERSSGGKSKKNAKKPTLVVGAVKSVAPKYDINNYDDDDFDDFMVHPIIVQYL